MKTHKSLMMSLTCVLAASAAACSGESNQPVAQEETASTQQEIIAATGNIMIWPAGAIAWDGLVGTWPISVWAPAGIGALAFDVAGATGLGISVVGFSNLTAMTISQSYLTAFGATTGLGIAAATPFLGTAGLNAAAFGFTGAFTPAVTAGFGLGAFAPGVGLLQTSVLDGVASPFLMASMTPALTTSALMFNNLVATTAFMPYTFNVMFTAQSAAAASLASMSVFATTIGPAAITAAAIPFTSIAYPYFAPVVAATPVLGAPLVGAGLAGAAVLPAAVAVPLL